jgi:predicted glycosyltransferase involved in capsule biosynthesis
MYFLPEVSFKLQKSSMNKISKTLKNFKMPDGLTILMLVRLDSIDRLENVILVTEYLKTIFKASLKILECGTYYSGILEKLLDKNINYSFIEDNDPILYRTKFLNMMALEVETPFVAIWDSDVIVPLGQIIKAVELLRNDEADFVYPYESQFLDTSPVLRKLYLEERNIEVLERNIKKMKEMYSPNPLGGAFLANLKAYKEAGLENENFYGWGLEDGERFYRWESLGYKIKRVPGPLFHLSHGRGINSTFQNPDQQLFKRKEIYNILRKQKQTL